MQAEEAAGRVGGTTVVTDDQGHALYFSKRLIPHLPDGRAGWRICRRSGCTSASMPTGRRRWTVMSRRRSASWRRSKAWSSLRFLVAGVPVAVVDVETPPFALRELNNPEDVEPIEQALREAGLE